MSIQKFAALTVLTFLISIQSAEARRRYVCARSHSMELKDADVSAALFSPNGDGRMDQTEISLLVSLRGPSQLFEHRPYRKEYRLVGEIRVELSGVVVRTIPIEEDIVLPRRRGTVEVPITVPWDGLLGNGQVAADGDYHLTVVLNEVLETWFETRRGRRWERERTIDRVTDDLGLVRVDTTPPTLAIQSPIAGLITNAIPIFVQGQSSDANGIAGLSVNDVAATMNGDQFSVSFSPPEGAATFVARATDAAGNQSESAPIGVTFDFTPPLISILCPQNGTQTSGTSTSLVGNVSDNIELASVTVNGIPANVIGNTFSIQRIDLLPGSNSLVAIATDRAGNSSTSSSIQVVQVPSTSAVIATIAGNGIATFGGDGQQATSASLNLPLGMAVDYTGALYIADAQNRRIRRIDPTGVITTFAGTGVVGSGGDGGPAINAQFRRPADLAFGPDGSLYVVDAFNRKVQKIGLDGIINTVAGSGASGNLGDGGPALQASFTSPEGIAVDEAGNIYIADTIGRVVRKVDTSGIITRFAGGGTTDANGIAATAALLRAPVGISITPAGEFLIADRQAHKIRKVDLNGVISTVAGNGLFSFGGDGGPATSASLGLPYHAVMDGNGNILIADNQNYRIRRVKPDGTIETVAGTGVPGFSGDGASPADAQLSGPTRIVFTGLGSYLISDTDNHRIRRIQQSSGGGTPDQCVP